MELVQIWLIVSLSSSEFRLLRVAFSNSLRRNETVRSPARAHTFVDSCLPSLQMHVLIVEQMRRDSPFQQKVSEIHMSNISVWYAFIQMFRTSTAEILDNPDNYHFASDVVPNSTWFLVEPFQIVSQDLAQLRLL